jgi:uncharacterized repeat protein (TIGR01451 family)
MYNAVNTNEDLTVPQYPVSPALVFPGADALWGTADDLRPYNSFLQQQTVLNALGLPLWLLPDVTTNPVSIQTTLIGDSLTVTVPVVNQGDAAIGSPVYVALYREKSPQTFQPADTIAVGVLVTLLLPGETANVIIRIPDITQFFPMANIVVRLNDNGKTSFFLQPECDTTNNVFTVPNPAIRLMMKKNASIDDGAQNTGTYPNPVSVLFSELVNYEIAVVNASTTTGNVTITDTLPPYLNYVPGSASNGGAPTTPVTGPPAQTVLIWTLSGLQPLQADTVTYDATPQSGAVASQPLFINRAWVNVVNNNVTVPTNSTYHQGAGVAVVTFSASIGGWIFNASEQALDYRTSPRPGVEIIPEQGYEFAGWSHDAYTSLRGQTIPADSGIYNYEDVVIHGNVELRANFVPQTRGLAVQNGNVSAEATGTSDKVWSNNNDLYIRAKKGAIIRIYTIEGVLQQQFTITGDGTTTKRLERGAYIVTLDGGGGWKAVIN